MPTRDISTRLLLEGEKEYKAAMKDVKRELDLLKSSMKLLDSTFAGQRNSMAYLEAKHKNLTETLAAQKAAVEHENAAIRMAEKYQTQYAEAAERAKTALAALKATTDGSVKGTDAYKKKIADAISEVMKYESAEAKATAAVDRHRIASNAGQVKVNDLNRSIETNSRYLDEAKASADGCAISIDGYGKIVKQAADGAHELADSSRQTAVGTLELADGSERGAEGISALSQALAAAGIAATLKEIADAIRDCLDASMEIESAMTGVAKTTALTDEELASMRLRFEELSTVIPMSASEMAQLAEIAGRLKISKENIVEFVQVMANLGVATNMTGEEAAELLAKFANVTKMSQEQFGNLGSAITALGNNAATNERDITILSQRIAAAGTLAHLTQPEILAIATAIASVGIEAEAGGTAFSKTLNKLDSAVTDGGEKLEQLAEIAGMSAADFAATWRSAPMAAIQAFITGLGRVNDSGESMSALLDDLGMKNIREGNMLKSLALSCGNLNYYVDLANSAWKENTALAKEAALRYGTTESKTKLLANSTENLKAAVGDRLKPAYDQLLETGVDVTQWAADMVRENDMLVPSITAVTVAVGVFAGGLLALGAAAKALTAIKAVLAGMTVVQPWMLVAAAIAAVVAAIAAFAATSNQASEDVRALKDANRALSDSISATKTGYRDTETSIAATSRTVDDLCDRLDALSGKQSLTSQEQAQYKLIVEQLNQLLPSLNLTINEQTGRLDGNTTAIRNNAKAWEEQARATAIAKQLSGYVEALTAAEMALAIADNKREGTANNINALERNRANVVRELADALGMSAEQLGGMSAEGQRYWVESKRQTLTAKNLTGAYTDQINTIGALHGMLQLYNVSIEDEKRRLNELVPNYAELKANLESATAEYEAADAASGELTKSLNEQNHAAAGAASAAWTVGTAITGYFKAADAAAAKTDKLAKVEADYKAKAQAASKSAKAHAAAMRDLGIATAEVTAAQQGYTSEAVAAAEEAYGRFMGVFSQSSDAQKAYAEVWKSSSDKIKAQLAEVDAAYKESLEKNRKTLDGQTGEFDKAAKLRKRSVKSVVDAYNSQAKQAEEYKTNLEKLDKTGKLSQEVMDKLTDGSKESMEAASSFVKEYEKLEKKDPEKAAALLQSITDAQSKASTAKDEASKTMTDLQTDLDVKKTELQAKLDEISAQFVEMAGNADQSLTIGTNMGRSLNAASAAIRNNLPTLAAWVDSVLRQYNRISGYQIKAPKMPTLPGAAGGTKLPGNANGIGYVPVDDYYARLHKGEMVLTALQAKAYRAERYANERINATLSPGSVQRIINNTTNSTVSPVVQVDKLVVRDDNDVHEIARELASLIRTDKTRVGG